MRITIVNETGTTTYVDSISPSETQAEEEDFSTILSDTQDAVAAVGSQTSSSSASSSSDGVTTLMDIFNEAAETYGVDVNLLTAIAKQESNFDASATSSAGAQGIMQLMPGTAESLGVTDSYDAYQNIMGGAKYISQLLDKYDGNVTLALAAYNAGSGNVAKYGGVPPFTETQNYVAKVTANYENGVEVPDIIYSTDGTTSASASSASASSSADKAEIASNLEKLLAQFPNYDSYETFLSEMSALSSSDKASTNADSTSSDAQEAYRQMLNNANTVIKNIISESDQ